MCGLNEGDDDMRRCEAPPPQQHNPPFWHPRFLQPIEAPSQQHPPPSSIHAFFSPLQPIDAPGKLPGLAAAVGAVDVSLGPGHERAPNTGLAHEGEELAACVCWSGD